MCKRNRGRSAGGKLLFGENTYAETIDLTIEKEAVSIQWDQTKQPYSGKALAPTAKGVWKDSKDAEHKVDLTVSVTEQEHTMPGTYHATVVGFENPADANNLTLPQNCLAISMPETKRE